MRLQGLARRSKALAVTRSMAFVKTALWITLPTIVFLALAPQASAGIRTDFLTYRLSSDTAFGGDSCASLGTSGEVTVAFSIKWDGPLDTIGIIQVGIDYNPELLTFAGGSYDSSLWDVTITEFEFPAPNKVVLILQSGNLPTPNFFDTVAYFTFSALCQARLTVASLTLSNSLASNEIIVVHPANSWSPTSSQVEQGNITIPAAVHDPCCLIAGDANSDGMLNVGDVSFLIGRIFGGGPAPTCCGAADLNSDGSVNIADVSNAIARIFSGGVAPACGPAGIGCQ